MRRLLCVALFLLCFAYGGIAGEAEILPENGVDLWFTYVPYVSDTLKHHEHGWKPIRIAVNMGTVYDGINACDNADGKGNGKYIRRGFTKIDERICDTIGELGHDRAVEYFRRVLVKAVKLHADRLLVKPAKSNLKFGKYGHDFDPTGPCSSVALNPDDSTVGVENADVAIYLDLTAGDKPVTHICKTDEHGRPIAANIRLRPKDVLGRGEEHVRFLAHQIAHGLGFDKILEKMGESPSGEDSNTPFTFEIKSDHIKSRLRDRLGCDDDVNVIKVERKHNRVHFPKSLVKGELMSTRGSNITKFAKTVYSPLTLAVLESTGYFKAEFNHAEDVEGLGTSSKEICEKLKE